MPCGPWVNTHVAEQSWQWVRSDITASIRIASPNERANHLRHGLRCFATLHDSGGPAAGTARVARRRMVEEPPLISEP